MDHWSATAVHQRREELLAQAEHARLLRQLESGRSHSIRGNIAATAQLLSDALAVFAQSLREKEV